MKVRCGYLLTVPAAVIVGLLHHTLMGIAWQYISSHTPIVKWLLTTDVNALPRHQIVFVFDVLTNLILVIPAALALALLRPGNVWVYLALAIVPFFVWDYRLVLFEPLHAGPLVTFWAFVPGIVIELTILPLVTFGIRHVVRRRNVPPFESLSGGT